MRTVRIGFLLGLGVGLMIASSVMFFVAMSDLNKKDDTNAQKQETTNNALPSVTPEKANGNVQVQGSTTTQITTIPESKNTTNNDTNDTKVTKRNIISIKIPKGSDSFDVAKILYDNKIISDKNSFQTYLEKQRKSTMLNYGTFNINQDSSYEEIIKKLTQ